jgi:hypothetical protein
MTMTAAGSWGGWATPTMTETNVANSNFGATSSMTFISDVSGYSAVEFTRNATGTGFGEFTTTVALSRGF